jgi:hypothetical protein
MTEKEKTLRLLRNEACSTCTYYFLNRHERRDWCFQLIDVPDSPTCENWVKADESGVGTSFTSCSAYSSADLQGLLNLNGNNFS